MGCTLNNIKLRWENRRPNKYRLAKTQVIQIDIQKEYDEALFLCQQDRYIEAQEKLQLVNQYYPNFPCLQMNLTQIKRLIQAKQKYDQGLRLFDNEKYQEALERFEDIQLNLQSNFKDVQKLIHDCRQKKNEQENFVKKYQAEIQKFRLLLQKIQDLEREREEQNRLIEQQKEQIRISTYHEQMKPNNNESKFYSSTVPQKEKNATQKKQKKPPIQQERLPPIDINSSLSALFNKVQIYYVCMRNPKCNEQEEGSFFIHSICGTAAFFHSNGNISCLNTNCEKYSIKEALFDCKTNQVFKNDGSQNPKEFESLNELLILPDFVEGCLKQDNHAEKDQNEFREQVSTQVLMKFLL